MYCSRARLLHMLLMLCLCTWLLLLLLPEVPEIFPCLISSCFHPMCRVLTLPRVMYPAVKPASTRLEALNCILQSHVLAI
jgi:hypothetical protein